MAGADAFVNQILSWINDDDGWTNERCKKDEGELKDGRKRSKKSQRTTWWKRGCRKHRYQDKRS